MNNLPKPLKPFWGKTSFKITRLGSSNAPARCKYRRFEPLANGRTVIIISYLPNRSRIRILSTNGSIYWSIEKIREDYWANTRICQWFRAALLAAYETVSFHYLAAGHPNLWLSEGYERNQKRHPTSWA